MEQISTDLKADFDYKLTTDDWKKVREEILVLD